MAYPWNKKINLINNSKNKNIATKEESKWSTALANKCSSFKKKDGGIGSDKLGNSIFST